jgi:hypothetical protein
MKILGYILLAYLALQLLGKKTAAAPVTSASGATLTPTGVTLGNVFIDDSGDLVTINSTGGTTVLPDPAGIGGGFAT